MTEESFGHQSMSLKSIQDYELDLEHLWSHVALPKKVIPLITPHQLLEGTAWSVAVERLHSEGFIPRICMSFQTTLSGDDIISKLKDISHQPDVTYSVISERPDRTLICSLYSRTIRKQHLKGH